LKVVVEEKKGVDSGRDLGTPPIIVHVIPQAVHGNNCDCDLKDVKFVLEPDVVVHDVP
jgi:hypothetical protein